MTCRRPVAPVVLLALALAAACRSPTHPPRPPLPAIPDGNRWQAELRAFEALDAAQPPPPAPIVFTGSSTIRLWQELSQDFPGHAVVNRGFGGCELGDVLQFFDRVIGQYEPRQVVVFCGVNDLANGKSVEQVVADTRTLVARVHAELPRTRFVFLSLAQNPARWGQHDQVDAANAAIAALLRSDPRDTFVDVTSVMLGPDGQPRPDIYRDDRLHMNRKGYELWRPLVEAALVP